MTPLEIENEIRAIRRQLDRLEERLRADQPPKEGTFADLYGILKADPPITDEEIEAAKYRMPEDDEL